MSIFDRDALEQSPLADLHAIATELSIDSFRRMRKGELIEAILARQEGKAPDEAADDVAEGAPDQEEAAQRRSRWRRNRGRRGPDDTAKPDDAAKPGDEVGSPAPEEPAEPHDEGPTASQQVVDRAEQQETVEGVVELLPGGSGFVRLNPPEPSDEDVYISSAQIRRCELVTGDRVSGPRRPPRRSERFASLLRVDSVNGRPATELADGVRFDELPIAFPDRRLNLLTGDELLAAIDRTAPIGRGSRVTIVGPPGAGKTETLRRLGGVLAGGEERVWLVLTGVRPEEIPEWRTGPVAPAAALSFAASPDAQAQALDGVVEQVRRLVARGTHAVLLIDTLDTVLPGAARKAMASARNVVDGGSLTVIATARAPVGGETTVVALAHQPSASEAAPAVDPEGSWTIRRQLLAV